MNILRAIFGEQAFNPGGWASFESLHDPAHGRAWFGQKAGEKLARGLHHPSCPKYRTREQRELAKRILVLREQSVQRAHRPVRRGRR